MPVQIVSLTPDGNYLDIRFSGGAFFHIYIENATVDTSGDGDMDHYIFTNPTFNITTYRTENSFHFEIGDDAPDIMFMDGISDALIDQVEAIVDIIIANQNKLKISKAPHIGVLTEGIDIRITDRNSVSLGDFEDDEECVLIRHANGNFTLTSGERCFVYHIPSLQGWFDSGNTLEPLTRVPITQAMLQRFKYSKPAGGGAAGGGAAGGGAAGGGAAGGGAAGGGATGGEATGEATGASR
jgi:hypothetical protein